MSRDCRTIARPGNVWVTNFYGDSISEISPSGGFLSNGTYTGGGLNHPQGIAVDGAVDVWTTNFRGPSLISPAGAASTVAAPVPRFHLQPGLERTLPSAHLTRLPSTPAATYGALTQAAVF